MKTCLLLFTALTLSAAAQQATALKDTSTLDQPVRTRITLTPKGSGAAPTPGSVQFLTPKSATASVLRVRINSDGTETHSPCLEVPLLFVVGSTQLLDATSRANLRLVAQDLITRGSQGQRFSIAGHASAEGDGVANQALSQARSQAIRSGLLALGVAPATLAEARGFGSQHARAPATASEPELQLDRRVLVVKEQ